ncbi:MAG TPA: DUF2867 domain-containing protein, partial [Acidimicrobiales bacterium]|nr:DUF2867 domain-containing protein [Acidimicrobiales bacterium]
MTRVLVTGASGFVGSRLVVPLLERGFEVRCLARTPSKLDAASWRGSVDVAHGDVGGDLAEALDGVDVAVYLVHSIGQGTGWADTERTHAANFARAAAVAHVRRIVFLGGLGHDDDALSEHLRARHDVGRLLASSGVEVVELRAGVIVGGGSASFEMLRKLVEVLPVMVTPKWVETRCQPIAITDVVELLVRAVATTTLAPGVYDAGGPDVVTYSEMMATFADVAGLPRRWLVRVPLLTTRLSSLWIGLVTPLPVPLARELVESLVNEVVVTGPSACEALSVEPLGLRAAMRRALEATGPATQHPSGGTVDAFSSLPTDPPWSGTTVLGDRRTARTSAPPEDVFAALERIGGSTAWYGARWLWWARGLLDRLVGGPGLRRGRSAALVEGDAVDFWRIEVLDPPRRLR